MKKRQGFVSNSSSSSFIVIGKKLENTNLKEELLKRVPELVEKWIKEQYQQALKNYPKYADNYKELNDDNEIEFYYDHEGTPLDGLVMAMPNEVLTLYEGIKIVFDDDMVIDIDGLDIPAGAKLYGGVEAT